MDINSLTASKIKELRLETGKSQVEIAKEMGISPSAYERLENGKVDINLFESPQKYLYKIINS